MKKLVLAAATASMLATPALAAPRHNEYQRSDQQRTVERTQQRTVTVNRTVRHTPQVRYQTRTVQYRAPAYQYRSWQRGQRFDARHAPGYREIDYRYYRGLRAPPRGYHWVRSGNDAVLVGIASGLIGAVIGGALAN
ncbi:RcnB family protein [Stakelama marina]|uniref:RcnB family protein n=1 Tax=Stakelama marina TaxID=2826939 RepID=A0A8T4IA16_9SPHN|nr:RcnB family protein [Stakelama marina]MBR0551211.1 RcnB family protein [Stakelama marina]